MSLEFTTNLSTGRGAQAVTMGIHDFDFWRDDYGQLPEKMRRELQRLVKNAAARLVRAYKSGYPTLHDVVHQASHVEDSFGMSLFSVGVSIEGGFFGLVEEDTAPHMPPWQGPTRRHPDRERTRLWEWVQALAGYPEVPVSAYPIARLEAAGRTSDWRGRTARRGASATLGRYIMTDRFALEVARLSTEFAQILAFSTWGSDGDL